MLILAYIILALVALYLLVYLYKKNFAVQTQREELKRDWGSAKNSRYIDIDLIENYFLNTITESSEKLQLISDKIADDLYINDVFKLIDRTISRVGQQFLYARLRTIDKDQTDLIFLDKFSDLITEDEKLRLDIQATLQILEKNDSYYFQDLIYAKKIEAPAFMPIVYILSVLNVLSLIAAIFHPGFLLVFFGIFIINSGIHYWNKNKVSVHTSSLGEFLKAFDTAKKLDADAKINAQFPEITNLIKELTPLKRKMFGVKLDNMAEADTVMIGYMLFELLKIAFNVEIILFYSIIDSLRSQKDLLKRLFKFIGTVDTAISIASLRHSWDGEYCKPVFNQENCIHISGVKHPLVINCVPNDLDLQHKNLLLTGSNMSGKTTFIRSVGVNLILGQTLFTCMAKEFSMPYSKIFSSITISDSLLEEKSYYFEEMRIIKNFIEESVSEEPCFFILDEIFKGTNTIERVSAGKAILSYLAKGNNMVFVSTHDTELNELLKTQYEHYHFSETIAEEELVFDHTIKKGPLKTRNAIRILEINNYPAAVIADANATVDLLMKD
ncbi:MutS-related protein [Pedobacter cryoconitis]|uniref:MutS-like protein n=1 Tax=Pedobacter cryoconitis TaxID=188932 RepID=A0A327TGS8_9SPHI|nr:DNA mismatch repair protein MutS [Pedobacter cryoconitis]RAJ37007.1 MutS-like protein [Pedobacter cryoconitis]